MNEDPVRIGSETYGPTTLLVLQPTPFCNIDCTYCYLPNRTDKSKMSLETLAAALGFLREGGLLSDRLSVLWHLGEPLAAGIAFYREAFSVVSEALPSEVKHHHSFQTNGALIDDDWCRLFAESGAHVGVSIDGPRELHDKRRLTRSGAGTHHLAMRGIARLKEHGVPFTTIAVLSPEALEDPDRIYDFFDELGGRSIGFNIEEVEGVHATSTFQQRDAAESIRAFYAQLHQRAVAGGDPERVRELKKFRRRLRRPPSLGPSKVVDVRPFSMFNVLHDGDFATYSPELLGHEIEGVGRFVFGNVNVDRFADVVVSERFQAAKSSIDRGIELCRRECQYFDLCGGGAPTNKYWENGTFECTETMFCRLNIQGPIDVALESAEAELGL